MDIRMIITSGGFEDGPTRAPMLKRPVMQNKSDRKAGLYENPLYFPDKSTTQVWERNYTIILSYKKIYDETDDILGEGFVNLILTEPMKT